MLFIDDSENWKQKQEKQKKDILPIQLRPL
jgi:hypothetical protein